MISYHKKIFNLDEVCLVIFVDFGNSEWINNKSLYPLQAEFIELKVQCIAVTLSNVSFFLLLYINFVFIY